MKYTLLAVDPIKKHVTFEMEDGIKQTVGDFPVDDAEALERALVNYASQYHSPAEEEVIVNSDVTDMIGKEKQVINIKIDDAVTPTAFDARLSLEEVKDIVSSKVSDIAEAVVTNEGVEITTIKVEDEPPVEAIDPVVEVAEPVSETVVVKEEPVAEDSIASNIHVDSIKETPEIITEQIAPSDPEVAKESTEIPSEETTADQAI